MTNPTAQLTGPQKMKIRAALRANGISLADLRTDCDLLNALNLVDPSLEHEILGGERVLHAAQPRRETIPAAEVVQPLEQAKPAAPLAPVPTAPAPVPLDNSEA